MLGVGGPQGEEPPHLQCPSEAPVDTEGDRVITCCFDLTAYSHGSRPNHEPSREVMGFPVPGPLCYRHPSTQVCTYVRKNKSPLSHMLATAARPVAQRTKR